MEKTGANRYEEKSEDQEAEEKNGLVRVELIDQLKRECKDVPVGMNCFYRLRSKLQERRLLLFEEKKGHQSETKLAFLLRKLFIPLEGLNDEERVELETLLSEIDSEEFEEMLEEIKQEEEAQINFPQ